MNFQVNYRQTAHLRNMLDSFGVAYKKASPNVTETSCRNGDVLKIIEFENGEFGIVGMSMEDAYKAAVFLS